MPRSKRKYLIPTRLQAVGADAKQGAQYLEYLLNYYPSGTKQVQGSGLDLIVERARENAIREILVDFRKKTGRDYGDDPQVWIKNLLGNE